jgi:hypothetical protein
MGFIPTFFTGFENYGSSVAYTNIYKTGSYSTLTGISGSSSHTGSYAALAHSKGGSAVIDINHGVTSDELYLSCWVNLTIPAEQTVFYFYTGDSNLNICFSNNATCTVYSNNTVIGDTFSFPHGVWKNLQVRIKIDSISGIFQIKVDGALVFDFTGNTQPGTSGVHNDLVRFYTYTASSSQNGYIFLDDIVIGTGGWPGDVRIYGITPNSDEIKQMISSGQSSQTISSAPTLTEGIAGTPNGTYKYKVTIVDINGETLAGPESTPITVSSKKIELSNIPLGITGTISRKVYRTENNGSVFKLLTTINGNTTTTYSDNISDESLGANEPSFNCYDKVDDASNSEFIYSNTDGQRTLFGLSDLNIVNRVPKWVSVNFRARKDTANDQKIKLISKIGDSEFVDSGTDLTTGYLDYKKILFNAPDGSEWDLAKVNDLRVGFESEIP